MACEFCRKCVSDLCTICEYGYELFDGTCRPLERDSSQLKVLIVPIACVLGGIAVIAIIIAIVAHCRKPSKREKRKALRQMRNMKRQAAKDNIYFVRSESSGSSSSSIGSDGSNGSLPYYPETNVPEIHRVKTDISASCGTTPYFYLNPTKITDDVENSCSNNSTTQASATVVNFYEDILNCKKTGAL